MVRVIDISVPDNVSPLEFGKMLRLRRQAIPLTLQELAERSGISTSHIGRIERGERFPSAKVLLKLACHLQYDENELFTLAGYLTSADSPNLHGDLAKPSRQLDPQVARVLAAETPEIQRAVISLLPALKTAARDINHH
jgi:transcriptional regulator with XRE-family HTH domain